MPGGRRKGLSGNSGWRLHWGDNGFFKVEQEGDGLTDAMMEEWGLWMDSQLERRFGLESWPPLTATTLNFSRNELGDEGVRSVVEYLRKREIGVQMVKFFKNGIGDVGAWAIGQLLAHAREPVHEVHLSHNRITEQGACAIFEAIARSRRYPYPLERAGRRDSQGLTPVWLRMEYNCIQWPSIEHRLDQQQVRWCAAESRDGWGPKDNSPMVCMHSSYKNQKSDMAQSLGGGNGQGAASRGRGDSGKGGPSGPPPPGPAAAPPDPPEEDPDGDAGSEEVPMYIFLDASAVRRFAADRGSAKERLFTFQGLLNLCQQGHIKCTPPDEGPMPAWVGPVQERDRIIFVVTDTVLDELSHVSEHSAVERRQMDWLRNAPDSYLQLCHQWGILEVLETKLHTQLIKLSGWEQRAQELRISRWALKNLDFACLWESQIESEGRVLFVTADEALCAFAAEAAASVEGVRRVAAVHVHKLDRSFASDREHGGHRLYEAAQKNKANKYCGSVLSAQIVHSLVIEPALAADSVEERAAASGAGRGGAASAGDLRHALKEALALLGDVRPVVEGHGGGDATKLLERIEKAQTQWQALLNKPAARS